MRHCVIGAAFGASKDVEISGLRERREGEAHAENACRRQPRDICPHFRPFTFLFPDWLADTAQVIDFLYEITASADRRRPTHLERI
jgi:hypothetical protein